MIADRLFALMSRDWAGLLPAALLGAGALSAAAAGAGLLAWPLAMLAGLIAIGAIAHLIQVRGALADRPPPGRLVDIGGFRLHLLAEGEALGKPPVVLFPGAHAASFNLMHLHRALREDGRSILIDRPGTGWSDPGPFPRTTSREADEMIAALESAGETGPFIFAGHSFGGFLAAAIARRYPERVAGLVLLDPTPPETIAFGPPHGALKAMRRGAICSALARLIGLRETAAERQMRTSAVTSPVMKAVDTALGADTQATLAALGLRSRESCAAASIFSELSAEGMVRIAWDVIAYDGDLGDMPVFLVAPGDNEAERAMMAELMAGQSPDQIRMFRFYARTRERYLATSTRSERITTPAGTGHNFVFEAPAFTADTLRDIRDRLGAQP